MRAARFGVVFCALGLSACALRDPLPRDELVHQSAPNLKAPAQWASPGAASGAAADRWLAQWNDPSLEALVAEALDYNADLRIAAARVDLAAAYLRAAGAPVQPQVNLLARGGGPLGGDGSGLTGIGLFASWELDLWGRVRSARAATGVQYDSARLDTDYARQSVAALVTKGWVLAIEARLAKARTEEMLRSAEQLASLEHDRLRVGVGDDYNVTLAQVNVQSFRDTVRSLDLTVQNSARALETLIGRYPAAALAVPAALPQWPGDLPAGLPSELLERRPDVVAAERRVAAAFYRVEEAKAARLPRFSLVGSVNTISSELFLLKERDSPVFSAGVSLMQPIFLGGVLQAQVDARSAEQQAAIAEYGKVSARAFSDVEGALSAGFSAAEREDILRQSVQDNTRALELAGVRYRVGSGDLRGVLQRQLTLYSAQVALLRMQSERLIQRVNLHLALGGSFADPAPRTGATLR